VEQQTSPPALADTADTALGAGQQEAEVLPGYQKLREPWTGDLDAIVDRGYLRALVVHSRTSYFLDGAQQRGITYEAMVEFERFLNEKVPGNRKVHVVFIPVRRDQLISAVADGTGDLAAANLTVTPARQKLVDFSDAAVRNVKEVVVTGPTGPTLSSLDDLSDQEVHVRRSSSYYESLLSLNETFRAAGRAPVKIRLADENLEDEDLLEMLNAELLPAVIIDDHKAKLWAQVFDQITIHHTIAVREGGTVAWALRKNSPRLLGLVNDFAKDHRAGTLFGNILLNRYFRSTKWVTNPGSKEQMARFRATVDLFKQYAGRYEFDWLLVMAQAYQESTLDQRMQSHVGAVGVMQLLPSTAAGSPINIPNVHKLEDNIHAGTKYLRYITDQYFSDPEINAVNKTLFAFASYNGGPNRIARLRRKAKEQGFDSNIWFKNVEVVAAREIGQENVQYVSNIYKYYIAYKLITEEQESSADGA
jgi:membrane-bound lytic murein transglycosylase MltF